MKLRLILSALTAALTAVAAEPNPWRGSEWISAADQPVLAVTDEDRGPGGKQRAADGVSWFVAARTNAGDVVSARWTTAGLGVYELYVNGRRVGRDFLKPGYTDAGKTKYAFAYDVTDLMNRRAGAENRLAAEVSSGWWRDKIVCFAGRKSAFRAVLEVAYADGSRETFGTDRARWRAGVAGPVRQAGIYDGETYDARVRCPFDGAGLGVPEPNREFAGEILPTAGAEICLREDLAMRRGPYSLKRGETLVVDFGQNCAGVPSFAFRAKRGTRLTGLPAETVNDAACGERGCDGPVGSVYRKNLRIGDTCMRLDYVFSGEGRETYLPRHTFFGYRYLSLTATDDVEIESVSSVPVTSVRRADEIGRIETGDASVNRLIENIRWGMRSNYLSVPTDCPQRNERLGWTADAQVFTLAGAYLADTRRFFGKWTRDLRDSQRENGAYPGVAPRGIYGNSAMRVGWSDAGILIPYRIWQMFGDDRIVRENWAAMARFLAHVDETRYELANVASECKGYQYADWLSFEDYEPHETAWTTDAGGRRVRKREAIAYWDFLGGCHWLWDARLMARMARQIGKPEDAAAYGRMAERALGHLRSRFVDPADGGLIGAFRSLQGAAAYALLLDVIEPRAVEATRRTLRENVVFHGTSNRTGFLGTAILMDVLSDNGMTDLAYSLLLTHGYPSWLYSVDQGATTIWERWNSYTKEKGFGPADMNSFNHYAYGAVLAWMFRTMAGIAPDGDEPGFRTIVMAPQPDRRIGRVEAEYRSAAGLIRSAWRYEGDEWIWNFEIPKGARARVTVPGREAVLYESGKHCVRTKGGDGSR